MDWFDFLEPIARYLPDRLDFLFSPLEGFLPDLFVLVIKWAIFLLAILVAFFLIINLIIHRNKMVVREFKDTIEDARFDGSRVAVGLRRQLQDIGSAHYSSAVTASGEVIDPAELQLFSENFGNKVGTLWVDIVGVGVLLTVVSWLLPRLELSGTMRLEGSTFQLDCTLTKRGYQRVFKDQVDYCTGPGPEFQLSTDLAYWLMVVHSPAPITKKHSTGSPGTGDWQALKAHTEALRLWGGPGFHTKNSDYLEKVGSKLKECIARDPDYALAHYNLGVLTYLPKRNSVTNNEAREHFKMATVLAAKSIDPRIEGLAWIGVSNCYSQDVHRFGIDSAKNYARAAASEAALLLPGDPRTLHASAFARHCTNDLGDIEEGRLIYEEIIKKYPDMYASVYGNLGYVLMVGGEWLQADGKDEKAKDWWRQAERNMKKTLSLDDKGTLVHRYACANLGNLHRVRRDFDEAFKYYLKALDGNPEESDYTEGLNELARLCFDRRGSGDVDQGLLFHKRALSLSESTDDEDHQKLKLMREVLAIKGHPAAESFCRLYDYTSMQGVSRDIETWMKKLTLLLKPAIESSPN